MIPGIDYFQRLKYFWQLRESQTEHEKKLYKSLTFNSKRRKQNEINSHANCVNFNSLILIAKKFIGNDIDKKQWELDSYAGAVVRECSK